MVWQFFTGKDAQNGAPVNSSSRCFEIPTPLCFDIFIFNIFLSHFLTMFDKGLDFFVQT